MSELTLVSEQERPIKSLVEGALKNESRLLEAGIHQTEKKLREFEKKYNMSTNDFITRYENDEIEEDMDITEWIGEYRMLLRLREKAGILKDIRVAH